MLQLETSPAEVAQGGHHECMWSACASSPLCLYKKEPFLVSVLFCAIPTHLLFVWNYLLLSSFSTFYHYNKSSDYAF